MQRVRPGARRGEDAGSREDGDQGEGANWARQFSLIILALDDRENLSYVVNVDNQWCAAIH